MGKKNGQMSFSEAFQSYDTDPRVCWSCTKVWWENMPLTRKRCSRFEFHQWELSLSPGLFTLIHWCPVFTLKMVWNYFNWLETHSSLYLHSWIPRLFVNIPKLSSHLHNSSECSNDEDGAALLPQWTGDRLCQIINLLPLDFHPKGNKSRICLNLGIVVMKTKMKT